MIRRELDVDCGVDHMWLGSARGSAPTGRAVGVGEESDRAIDAIHSELDRFLAEDGPFGEVAPGILQALCVGLGWDVGIMWKADELANVLRFVESWHDPSIPSTQLERLSARSTFSPGIGLPGRMLSSREPAWIRDVQNNIGFPRALPPWRTISRMASGSRQCRAGG
jgi:hypothetical protein